MSVAKRQAPPTSAIARIDEIVVDYVASFFNIGPIGIPGYAGSGLCTECGPDAEGRLTQVVNVTSCVNSVCRKYVETWVAAPATSQIVEAVQAFTSSFFAQETGAQTVTLAPAVVSTAYVTAPTTIVVGAGVVEAPTNGVYTFTVGGQSPGVQHPDGQLQNVVTATVTNAPAMLTLAPATHVYHEPGVYVMVIIQAITININIRIAPTIVIINTTLRPTFEIGINPTATATVTDSVTVTTTATATTTQTATETVTNTPAQTPQPVAGTVAVADRLWEYEGCFGSVSAGESVLVASSATMTIETCLTACPEFTFAALSGQNCYCSNSSGSGGNVEGSCNTPCPGNPAQSCGGTADITRKRQAGVNFFSFYENLGPDPDATPTSTTPPNPDPSSDPDPTPVVKARQAHALERSAAKNKIRRAGILRSPKHEAEKVQARKRDFGIKEKRLLH